jgi:hypothetical protein
VALLHGAGGSTMVFAAGGQSPPRRTPLKNSGRLRDDLAKGLSTTATTPLSRVCGSGGSRMRSEARWHDACQLPLSSRHGYRKSKSSRSAGMVRPG